MTKIIYLTNAMHFNDFEKMMKFVETSPNPSNQNFHYRFIKSLNGDYNLKVISQRPLNNKNSNLSAVLDEFHHNFYYPGFHLKPLVRNLDLYKNSIQIIRSLRVKKSDFVFVDLLNLNLTHLAKYMKNHYKTKIIGILTDNPNNLSDVKKSYVKNVEKSFAICDGFVFLTEGLATYANENNKPYTIINGVISYTPIEDNLEDQFGKYIYFAGALYERYGVKNLIEAFLNLKTDLRLVIAGHGPLRQEIALLAESHPRIDFVGSISPYKSLVFANEAFININPRPFAEALDKYSVPSKVIEFANTGRPLVSCHNSILENIYKDNVCWADDSVASLQAAIKSVYDNYADFEKKAQLAKDLGEKSFGKQTLVSKIQTLIESLTI